MAILTKLLDINIVANSLSGLFIRINIFLSVRDCPCLIFSILCGDREKKATSEPEIRAEEIISSIKKTISKELLRLKELNEILVFSHTKKSEKLSNLNYLS